MKIREITELSVEELKVKLAELKDKLFKTKFQHSSTPNSNPMLIRNTKKDIARILTVIQQKESKK